jgi:hypothetical protein
MTNTNSAKRPRRMAREPKKAETVVAPDKAEAAGAAPEREVRPGQPKRPSKAGTVLTLLRRTEGATLDELVAATGWLPHTTRAALTGLKKGHQITRIKVEGVSRYTVAQTAPR